MLVQGGASGTVGGMAALRLAMPPRVEPPMLRLAMPPNAVGRSPHSMGLFSGVRGLGVRPLDARHADC